MNEKETAKRISLLEREISVLVEDLDKIKLDFRSEVDILHIEVESLKTFLQKHNPAFSGSFGSIKSQTLLEKNPEWRSEQL